MWLRHVPLDHIVVMWPQLLNILKKEDTLSLTGILGLNNKSSTLSLIFFLKMLEVLRKHPRFGKKVILIRKHFGHFVQVLSQHIFSGKVVNSWKMISSLIESHFFDEFYGDPAVKPCNVPVTSFFLCQMVV